MTLLRALFGLIVLGTIAGFASAQPDDEDSPRPAAREAGPEPGLITTASDGERRAVFLSSVLAFTLEAGQSIHPQVRPKAEIAWTGVLRILRAGSYRFSVEPPGRAAQVSVDGRDVLGGAVDLTPGERPIRIVVAHDGAAGRFQLFWEADYFRPEPLPGSALGHRETPPELAAFRAIERGRALVEELNCTGCHRSEIPGLRGRRGPDLTDVGSRTDARWIAHWLEDPRKFRPGAVMPVLLDAKDHIDAAAYLAGLHGAGKNEEKSASRPTDPARIHAGELLFDSVGCASCHDSISPTAGGPKALNKGDPKKVSLAGLGSKTTTHALRRFLQDPLAVDPSGRMPDLMLPEDEASALADYLVQSRNKAFETEVPAGDTARGRAIVASAGCLACHTIGDPAAPAVPTPGTPAAPPLSALGAKTAEGCLSESPAARVPRYALPAAEREALAAFLKSPDVSDAPIQDLPRAADAFRCTSCHELDDVRPEGLPDPPPLLTGAGLKLRAAWLTAVLTEKKRIRPWMALRMPHFGKENVRRLIPLFAAASGAEPGDGPAIVPPTPEQLRDGVLLLGKAKGALSCITCHDFRGRISTGTRGPDMAEMARRLRPDWFRRWMRDPSRIRPGTAMPSFFPAPAGPETESTIDRLWACLSAGDDLPLPEGLTGQSLVLPVRDAPVLLRTFMPDASPRAIAVGLPGSVSYCFDAEACRLRYAWSGDFLDVTPVWTGRGGARALPVGPRFYTAPDAFPLRLGDPEKGPRLKFRGYTTGGRPPEFLYEADGVEIRERIEAAPPAEGARPGIVRSFEIGTAQAPPPDPVWFLAGPRTSVAIEASAGEWTGDRLRLPGGAPLKFSVTIRAGGGK